MYIERKSRKWRIY